MGQAQFACCCDKGSNGKADFASSQPGSAPSVPLSLASIEPGAFRDCGPLEDANEALQEALQHSRSGRSMEAVARLQVAEGLLREAPNTLVAEQLRRACCTDPELQVVRQWGLSYGISGASSPIEKPARSKKKKTKKEKSEHTGGEDRAVAATALAASLEAELAEVRVLCSSVQLFEAQVALGNLLQKTKLAYRECRGCTEAQQRLEALQRVLRQDAQLEKLHHIHGRMTKAVKMLQSSDPKGCAPVVITDPLVGDRFKMEVVVRSCEGAEYEKGGANTQLFVIVRVVNWPISLVRTASVDIEADLYKREWTKDCKSRDTTLGREAACMSNLTAMSIALSPLPISLEDIMIREFAIFSKAPVSTAGPGILVLESGATVGSGRFENWTVPPPPKSRGHYRLGAGMKVHYKFRGTDGPEFTDMLSISKVDLPIPTFLLPISSFRSILAKKCAESLRLMKEDMLDRWSELEFEARIEANPKLYDAVRACQDAAEAR